MLNQGLEALAALASASSSSSRGGSNTSNQQMNSVGHAPSVAAQQHNAEQNGNAAGGNIAAPPGQQPSGGQQQQTWHQAPLTVPNLALFQGLQQLPPAHADTSRLLSMQQQVTYLNYLMNAQKQKAPHPTASIQPNAAGTIAGLDANQALQLALSGHPAAGLLQKQGVYINDRSREAERSIEPPWWTCFRSLFTSWWEKSPTVSAVWLTIATYFT